MATIPGAPVVERHRRLDWASVLLMLTGLVAGGYSIWLIAVHGHHPILLIPSACAAVTGARHLTKWEAREVRPTPPAPNVEGV